MKGISICYCILLCLVLIQVVWSQEDEEAAINAQAEQQSALISNALGGAAPSIESYIASKSKHVRKPDDETDSSMKSDKMKKKDAESEAGACNGGNDNACCVGYQETATCSGGEVPNSIFTGSKTKPREAALLKVIGCDGIIGVEAQQFMAQMAHESDQFKAMEEYASGAAYEGRSDLGNTQAGDGKRYKGRGYIQLTGRANYITYGKKLGLDLVNNPEKASDPSVAAQVAVSYWYHRVKPRVENFEDTRRVTKLINGGQNGLQDRINKFEKYKKAGFQPAGAAGGADSSASSDSGDPEDMTSSPEEKGGHGAANAQTQEAKESAAEVGSDPSRVASGNAADASGQNQRGGDGDKLEEGDEDENESGGDTKGQTSSPEDDEEDNSGDVDGCGPYDNSQKMTIEGNGGTKHQVVKIVKAHLSDPSYFDRKPDEKDNTMTIKTACMFYKMHMAAKKAGVLIRINSGFRTVGRQQYFWNLYKSGKGNLAARPGTSRHGIGTALDLNTNCGRQNPGSVPTQCKSSNVYCWMINNAHKYNFKRTVANEPWHWEFTEGWNAGPVNGKLNHNGRNIVYGQFSHEPQPGDPNQKCKKNIPGTCTTPEQCQSNGGQTKGGACNGGSDNVCCVSQ